MFNDKIFSFKITSSFDFKNTILKSRGRDVRLRPYVAD